MIRVRTMLALAFAALATAFLSPLQWLGLKTGLYSGNRILRAWHRSMALALGLRIRVVGNPAESRPLLIAANHVSWTDITVLGSIADVSFIAKSEMAGWPLIGWLATLQGTIFIDRDRRRTSGDQAAAIAARLAEGDALVLFPEGTTGDGNMLLRFKSALFGAADLVREAGHVETVWVQPVSIAYTRLHGVPLGRRMRPLAAWIGDQNLVDHIRLLLAHPALDVEVRFGEPIAYTGAADRKATARAAELAVAGLFQASLAEPL